MRNTPTVPYRPLVFVIRHLPAAVSQTRLSFVIFCCLLAAACSRAPQTAAELFDRMPRRFQGELHVQGDTGARTLTVEALDLGVRDAHLLEFKRISYRIGSGGAGGAVDAAGEAHVKGTISAPGGEIRIKEFAGGGEDALKPGTFEGKLSDDLQSLETHWQTSYGQAVRFEAKAAR